MKKIYKRLFLTASVLFLGLLFFLPVKADAQVLGTIDLHVVSATATSETNMRGAEVYVTSTKDNTYKWKRKSTGNCYGCRTGSFLESWDTSDYSGSWSTTTGSGGLASFGNGTSSGIACGHSECTKDADSGDCNPFKLKITPSGTWTSGRWEIDVLGTTYKRDGIVLDFNFLVENDANKSFEIRFYGVNEWDNLSTSFSQDSGNSSANKVIDCVTDSGEMKFDWGYKHGSSPSHGIDYNRVIYTRAYDGKKLETIDLGNGTKDGDWYKGTTGRSFSWIDLGLSDSRSTSTINVKYEIECDGDENSSKSINITFTRRAPAEILCGTLSAQPTSGYVPLAVTFTANFKDSWCRPVTNYRWIFDSENQPTDWSSAERTTSTTNTHTYTTTGSHTAWVIGEDSAGNPTNACSTDGDSAGNHEEINSETWSQSDYQEIAP